VASPIIADRPVSVASHAAETVIGGRHVGVGSHAHRVGSTDPADHQPITGREEAWRFTPLRRLRGLHSDAAFTGSKLRIAVEGPDGITAVSLSGAEAAAAKGLSKYQPIDYAAARTYPRPTRSSSSTSHRN